MKNKEKAPKASKKPKKQKAQKEANVSKEPSEKKKIPKIFLIILPVILLLAVAFVVVYMVFFRAPTAQDEIDKIVKMSDIYKVGSDEIPSLESTLEAGVVRVPRPLKSGFRWNSPPTTSGSFSFRAGSATHSSR